RRRCRCEVRQRRRCRCERVPPRTAVLGLIANILGLPKDALANELADACVALSGPCPPTHWHACNQRKIKAMRFLPATFTARKPVELTLPEEDNTQLRQEWLCNPDFEVTAVLPAALHDAFVARVREGRTHFTPCMGLSEMLASIEYLSDETLTPLPDGLHRVRSLVRHEGSTRLAIEAVMDEQLRVLSLSMPRTVTEARQFTHANYFVAPNGDPLPVHTSMAWQSSAGALMFL
ncbi:MAG: CRISPR-associated protein Cas5, partial [Myxococcales bacterium]